MQYGIIAAGYYFRNDDGPSHFYYAKGERTIRSLCGGLETSEPMLARTDHVSCLVCRGDLPLEPESVRLSGPEPELTNEEYMILFNRNVNEGEELQYHLPATKDLTPEQLVDHVNLLSKFALRVRVAKQAAKVTLEQKKIHLGKAERDALKLRDQQYKPKPPADPDKPAKARRKAGTAKSQDAIEMMMELLGITREQAEKRLAKAEARANAEEAKGE